MVYKCQFCNKVYKTERGLNNHTCEYMLRIQDSNINRILNNWLMYKTIYKISTKKNTKDEVLDMVKSTYYKTFKQFSDWCDSIDIVDTYSYIGYLKKYNVPLKMWVSDRYYKMFLNEYIQTEPLANACERSINELKKCNLTLETISQNRLFLLLLSGKLSIKYLDSVEYPYRKILDDGQKKELNIK